MDALQQLARKLYVLADEVSLRIVGVLAQNKKKPVPVRTIARELHISRTAVDTRLQHLFGVELVSRQGRRGSYFIDDSTKLRAVIGLQSYRKITQGFGTAQNENAPGTS
jgi:DNA-binding Lrp family transcriptional regulator